MSGDLADLPRGAERTMLLGLLSVGRERCSCLWGRAEVFWELVGRSGRVGLTGVVCSSYIV